MMSEAQPVNGRGELIAYAITMLSIITAVTGPLYMGLNALQQSVLRLEQKTERHAAMEGHDRTVERVAANSQGIEGLDTKLQREMHLADESLKIGMESLDRRMQKELEDRVTAMRDNSDLNRALLGALRADVERLKRSRR